MVLKSSPFFKRAKSGKPKRRTPSGDFVTGATTAILGISLLGVTAGAVAKL